MFKDNGERRYFMFMDNDDGKKKYFQQFHDIYNICDTYTNIKEADSYIKKEELRYFRFFLLQFKTDFLNMIPCKKITAENMIFLSPINVKTTFDTKEFSYAFLLKYKYSNCIKFKLSLDILDKNFSIIYKNEIYCDLNGNTKVYSINTHFSDRKLIRIMNSSDKVCKLIKLILLWFKVVTYSPLY